MAEEEKKKLNNMSLIELQERKIQVKMKIRTSESWLEVRDLQKYLDKIDKAINKKLEKIWHTN